MKFLGSWKAIILFCVIPGLAPFMPEPHIWGKLKWIAGGGVGMGAIDWLDALFHGLPWILLLRLVTLKIVALRKANPSDQK
jgi:hypothetical protein